MGLEWRRGQPRELLTVYRTTARLFLEFRISGIRSAEWRPRRRDYRYPRDIGFSS